MNLKTRIVSALLKGQHGHPRGITGRMLGQQMVRQHIPETTWTISLLNIQPDDQVLELGFGAGRAIELVAAQANSGHIYGLDHSQEMVQSATRRNSRAIKTGHVTLYHGDLATLPFADNQFDKIFTIQTLYFWSNPAQILNEIFRTLKPEGILVITLSTGTMDGAGATGLERYQTLLEEQIIPCMKQLGFNQASIKQGPASRQFKTTAVIGIK